MYFIYAPEVLPQCSVKTLPLNNGRKGQQVASLREQSVLHLNVLVNATI